MFPNEDWNKNSQLFPKGYKSNHFLAPFEQRQALSCLLMDEMILNLEGVYANIQ